MSVNEVFHQSMKCQSIYPSSVYKGYDSCTLGGAVVIKLQFHTHRCFTTAV